MLKNIIDDVEVAMENLSLSAFNALAPLSKDCGDTFDYISPNLSDELSEKIMEQNPLNMLKVN